MTRNATPREAKAAKAPAPAASQAQALPADLVLITPIRYRGKPYAANEVIHPAELGMDTETVRWLVATGTVEDPDGDEK